MKWIFNKNYFIVIIALLISFFFLSVVPYHNKEGFTKNKWSDKTLQDFITYENTTNPNFIYDTDIVQEQVTDEDVAYLIKNGSWYWTQTTQELYKEAILSSSSISIDPNIALVEAQKIYNEAAIKLMLAWNTKEGNFLLSGVTVGNTKNVPDNLNNIIRCSSNGSGLEKITNLNYIGNQNITPIKNEDVEEMVPGFKFINGTSCNVCSAINGNYDCPFSLNIGDGENSISSIWQNLWNL